MAYVKAPIPSEVYHLTKKANLESILDDGAIRRFDDTECWFCESLAKMKAYMEQTVLCEGKPYYGAGGRLCHYPKFEPEQYVILKLTPCRREGNWYRWNQEIPLNSPPELVQAAADFSKLKIGFRRDLPFRNAEAIDVAEFLHGSIVCRNVQTTSELWKRLSEKVEQNWQTYQRNLYDRSPSVLIGIADEIAATATCYSEFLCSGSDLSRRDLSYLLQFENPLDVLRDRWVLDQSTEQGTRFLGMLESLRSEGHAEQDYPLDEAYAQTQKNEMTMQLYDSPIDAEHFASEKCAIFLIIPEEDPTKHFMAGLMIQNLSRELFSIADANEGKLKKRVVFYCDEFGTMPPFDVLPLFSAGRSRKLTLVPIIQSLAQLEKNYGKEGAEIIADNCQDTIFGGFAPNSQTAETLSKALGSRTVLTGSISKGKDSNSQSLQMAERALLSPDELKSLPKGEFVVMKTGTHPMRTKLQLYFKWGIKFEEPYQTPERAQREVYYAGKEELLMNIKRKSLTQMRSPTAPKADDYMSSYAEK